VIVHEMPDGTRLRLRYLTPSDGPLLARGMAGLSPQSRQQRFLAAKTVLSEADLRRLTAVDAHDHVAIVAVHEADPVRLAGVARFIRDPEQPERAEIAITIADALQGQGLGRALGLALADVAKGLGVRRFTASLLGTNLAAHRLFHAMSRHVQTAYSAGIADLVVELETREHPILPESLAA
jgi:RimJ/RimL family protein N-acetyltransferase